MKYSTYITDHLNDFWRICAVCIKELTAAKRLGETFLLVFDQYDNESAVEVRDDIAELDKAILLVKDGKKILEDMVESHADEEEIKLRMFELTFQMNANFAAQLERTQKQLGKLR